MTRVICSTRVVRPVDLVIASLLALNWLLLHGAVAASSDFLYRWNSLADMERTVRAASSNPGAYPACSDEQANEYMRIFNKCKPCLVDGGECPDDCCASASAEAEQAMWCEIGTCCARAAVKEGSRSAMLFLDGASASGDGGGKCADSLQVSSDCKQCAFASDIEGNPTNCDSYPFLDSSSKLEAPTQCQTAAVGTAESDSSDSSDSSDQPDEDTDSKCFPAAATVELESGDIVTINSLAIGDRVRVAPNEFSTVFMFTHKTADVESNFVHISTDSGRAVALTTGHYVHTSVGLKAAAFVGKGDRLILSTGLQTVVTNIGTVRTKGLFNPQTVHGDIVVDGLIASTYTTHFHPVLAHASLHPLRWLYAVTGFTLKMLESGTNSAVSLVPAGRSVYN